MKVGVAQSNRVPGIDRHCPTFPLGAERRWCSIWSKVQIQVAPARANLAGRCVTFNGAANVVRTAPHEASRIGWTPKAATQPLIVSSVN